MDKKTELEYIKKFIKENNNNFYYNLVPWQQLKALWVAYCLHHDLIPDTMEYDYEIKNIYEQIINQTNEENLNIKGLYINDFKTFDLFMGSVLA